MTNPKPKKTPPETGPRELPPEKSISLLQNLIEDAESLLEQGRVRDDDHSAWELLAHNYLEKTFGTNSPNITAVTLRGRYGSFPVNAGEEWWEVHRATTLKSQIVIIKRLIELLETEASLHRDHVVSKPVARHGHKIFLVHGHNDHALQETARFLEKLCQEVIVLREQPNNGMTIVEKFEDYADVGFAIVLLTADDLGGSKSSDPNKYEPRARQNVVFELGYFNGRIGRSRVCALYEPGVEIPSDYAGVLYIEYDDRGAWRLKLAKELRAAGLGVDMNDAL